mmetsp:Transcript_42423/g.76171  ORF Transcript_42423/g.76171 Transcript_42423/m.76171 type:complete len:775 (+) Transcript_42423:72-2396(+)
MGKGGTPKGGTAGKLKWKVKGEDDEEEEAEAPKGKGKTKAKTPKNKKPKEEDDGKEYDRAFFLRLRLTTSLTAEVPKEVAGLTTTPKVQGEVAMIPLEEEATTKKIKKAPADEPKEVAQQRKLLEQFKATKSLSNMSLESGSGSPKKNISLVESVESNAAALPETPTQAQQAQLLQQSMFQMYLTSMWSQMAYQGYQTTVMLRNIPNRYTRDELIKVLDKTYKDKSGRRLYDFVYLPIDFNSKCNVGYAFINFRDTQNARRFVSDFHNKDTKTVLPGYSSKKVIQVSWGKVQGKEQNIANLKDEKFIEKLEQKPEWQPLFYDDYGKEIPFKDLFGSSKRGKKSSATPKGMPAPTTPTGFFPPYAPMMYSPYMQPPAPPMNLASALPTAMDDTIKMLRGIPKHYSRSKMLEFLGSKYPSQFDFLFLPGEAKGEGNRDFAFINFTSAAAAEAFAKDFNDKKITDCYPDAVPDLQGQTAAEKANEDAEAAAEVAKKVCLVVEARKESLEKSIERLQMQCIEQPDETSTAWHPVLLKDGEEQEFPKLSAALAMAAARAQAKAQQTPKAASSSSSVAFDPTTPKAGKKAKTPKAAAVPPYPYGMYQYGFGYPGGYPAYGGYGQLAEYQQRAALAAQHAHMQAHAAATGYARSGSGSDSINSMIGQLGAAVNPRVGPMTEKEQTAMRRQFEYYFSFDNLVKDTFLRDQIGEDGWASLETIKQFNMIAKFSPRQEDLVEALTKSDILEVKGNSVRLKKPEDRQRVENMKQRTTEESGVEEK